MTFGSAIEALKSGARVAREGWNGKGMWLALTEGSIITCDLARAGAAAHLAAELLVTDALASHPRPCDRSMIIRGHIDMRNAQGELQVGWTPSQADMLANDWRVVE